MELAATFAQPCRTGCAFCDWSFEGSVQEGHSAFLAHVAARHRERAA